MCISMVIKLYKLLIKSMIMARFFFTLLLMTIPFFSSALEPIFTLKGKSIILDSSPSTLGVVYNADAVINNDFSKKNLSAYEIAGKELDITNVNIINWDKKSQGLIIEFTCEGQNFCFYFPQQIHTSDISKGKPFSRFYSGSFMDRYQNKDDSHYVKPNRICLTFWLSEDVNFLQSKIGSKFHWNDGKDTYLFTGLDLTKRKFEYRKFDEGEIKPSKTITTDIQPAKTCCERYRLAPWYPGLDILKNIVWEE